MVVEDSQHPVRALVVDYGGVLTTPIGPSFASWLAADGIDPDAYSEMLRDWLGRDAPADSPVHRLERGELRVAEFNRLLAARLTTVDGRTIVPEGLLDRAFATVRPDADMLDLLRAARAAGLRTALLSNSWGNSYPMDVLTPLFDVLVISGEVGMRKPDERIYRHTADRLGLPPRQCLFLDDAQPNVDGAIRSGMRALLHTDSAATIPAVAGLVPELAEELREGAS
ncbi:HAD family phosphatase [Allokutzneria sp. A3M-2-11 16]|uniref:HAD family hydrolase n=1 Tax=Allokutzneria sp. A3M-2-11 16 TaxID=2962043 RepID=UPI0020B67D60|nr:HAD family phosphatase [Allokutzneria sp. A3M-2-11 16]MCP3804446.1 HAD family phosphatase [Allokutzneria sp. A3M-2-11 16]